MPRKIKPLTDLECKRHRYSPDSRGKNKLRDGDGLLLEALPSGRKVWRLEYRTAKGTRSEATLPHDYGTRGGALTKAREWRVEMRALIAQGVDPTQHAKAQVIAKRAEALATFRAAADEWMEHKFCDWAPATREKVKSTLENVLLPWLGDRPVAAITPQELLHCLQRYERQGKRSSAHNARSYAGQIFRRSVILGQRLDDPAAALKGALKPKNEKNMAHLTDPAEIGGLLRAIDAYAAHPAVRHGLRLLPLLFCRPGELRAARWSEFNLPAALWEIPAVRTKLRRPHLVPLSAQALEVLGELADLTRLEGDDLLFPNVRHRGRPMSENTFNAALAAIGYGGSVQTPHGFRHVASTRLHELGWASHLIERQMAHADSNAIRGVYNKAEYLPDRTRMMQAWADYLDQLRAGGCVVPIHHAGKRA